MRRLYSLLVIMLLFSVAHMAAARSLRIDRRESREIPVARTAVTDRKPVSTVGPLATVPSVPSMTSSTVTPTTTTTISATVALSATGSLSSTDALTHTLTLTDVLSSTQAFTATVIGYVREVGTGKPIAGANVIIGGVAITSRSDGLFGPTDVPLSMASEDVDGMASADGYDPWTFRGIPLEDDRKLDVHIQLRPKGTAIPAPSRPVQQPSAVGAPPATIRLGITGNSKCVVPSEFEQIRVVEMPFTDYLRNVLPNEWVSSWPDASLDAGAVAVKQFAWYTGFIERKWSSQGYTFDLLDSTCDQHYVRNSFKPSTDEALRRTWALSLTRDGKLFPTYYRDTDARCAASGSRDCMGQWGTEARARAGVNGINILLDYYQNVVVEGLPRQNPVFLPLVITS